MKKPMVITIAVLVLIFGYALWNSQKQKGHTETTLLPTSPPQKKDIFKDMTDLCATLTKEQVGELLGKTIRMATPLSSGTLYSCQYGLNETQSLTVSYNLLNIETQKKGHLSLGRTITTNPAIDMDHFLVVQENGLINEIYLVLGNDNYISINRTSSKTITEGEIIAFAQKLAQVITGQIPLKNQTAESATIVPTQGEVPLPLASDIARSFFSLIGQGRISEAVMMMSSDITKDDSVKQAWGVQLNAMKSLELGEITPLIPESQQANERTYKVAFTVQMDPSSATAPIPYYGYENGKNIRWITLEKEGKMWKVMGLATGP